MAKFVFKKGDETIIFPDKESWDHFHKTGGITITEQELDKENLTIIIKKYELR